MIHDSKKKFATTSIDVSLRAKEYESNMRRKQVFFLWNIMCARNGHLLLNWLTLTYVICYSRPSNSEMKTTSMFVILIVTNSIDCHIIHVLSHCFYILMEHVYVITFLIISFSLFFKKKTRCQRVYKLVLLYNAFDNIL